MNTWSSTIFPSCSYVFVLFWIIFWTYDVTESLWKHYFKIWTWWSLDGRTPAPQQQQQQQHRHEPTGTYRFRLEIINQHSVKIFSNPNPGRSEPDSPEMDYTDTPKCTHDSVSRWRSPHDCRPFGANTKRNPQGVTEVTCWQSCLMLLWQDFHSIIDNHNCDFSHECSRQIAKICEGHFLNFTSAAHDVEQQSNTKCT